MRNGPCTLYYWTAQNEHVVANQRGGTVPWKNETVGEKNKRFMNSVNYLPLWPRSRTSLEKGRPTYT